MSTNYSFMSTLANERVSVRQQDAAAHRACQLAQFAANKPAYANRVMSWLQTIVSFMVA